MMNTVTTTEELKNRLDARTATEAALTAAGMQVRAKAMALLEARWRFSGLYDAASMEKIGCTSDEFAPFLGADLSASRLAARAEYDESMKTRERALADAVAARERYATGRSLWWAEARLRWMRARPPDPDGSDLADYDRAIERHQQLLAALPAKLEAADAAYETQRQAQPSFVKGPMMNNRRRELEHEADVARWEVASARVPIDNMLASGGGLGLDEAGNIVGPPEL